MTKNERAAVVVKAFKGNTHLAREVDVVNSEGVMCFDCFDFGQADTRRIERTARRWNRCLRHEALLRARLAKPQHLYFNRPVAAEFPGALTRGYYHAAVPIGWMRLRTEADRAALLHRAQSQQSLRGGRVDPFVVRHRRQHFAPGKIFHIEWSDHETAMKSSVVLERILILLVAQQREGVLLFPGD